MSSRRSRSGGSRISTVLRRKSRSCRNRPAATSSNTSALVAEMTRKVNLRVISATNADVFEEVAAGRFRQDLLFRLNTVEIRLPPLRERREDIPLLAAHFLRVHSQHYRKRLTGYEPPALQLLVEHNWPGNVRELDHAVERGVLMAQGQTLRYSDFSLKTCL